jgi:hypothetical protein
MDQQQDVTGRAASEPAPPTLHALAVAEADVDAEVDLDLGLEEDQELLRDAAAVLVARRRLDALLTQLAAQPFSASAYSGLRAYLAGPADRALAAYQRVCASTTVRPGR